MCIGANSWLLRLFFFAAASASAGCTVGDRYLISSDSFTAVRIMRPDERVRHAVPARRIAGDRAVYVRAHAFSLEEGVERPDDQVTIPTRLPSRRVQAGNALVWIGTPLSIAGLCMVIWGRDAVRYSGIALAAAAEPMMIAGTVLWIQGARAHPQEVPRGVAELSYLPEPGQPASPTR